MHTDQNKRFTVGQFAAIHGTTKRTLIWYDEMGILKPSVIGENGYRYYTYAQSSMLETILMLRELNVSIDEIRDFMCDRSAHSMEQLLREKLEEVESSLRKLKNMQQILESRHRDMMTLLQLDLDQISIVEKEACYLAVVPMQEETAETEITETKIERVIEETKKHQIHGLHDAVYGSMIAVESLYQGEFDRYDAIYVEVPNPVLNKGLHLQPAGRYLRAFCKGSWDRLPDKYHEILAYAKAQGLTLHGYAYETGINESVISSFRDYITQIEIPIKK